MFSDTDIPALRFDVMKKAQYRWDSLTKPLGSLGILENIVVRLSGMTGMVIPSFNRPHALIFAADHGISEKHVSAYESKVTEEMAVNMCMGSAVSSVLARASNVDLQIIDVGIKTRVRHPNVISCKVANGTNDFTVEPAMTLEQAQRAVLVGVKMANDAIENGVDLMVIGELGIGNTTVSTAIIASLLKMPVDHLVGMGTGLSEEETQKKKEVIESALRLHSPDPDDPWDVLRKVGGFEIAAMVGTMIQCAHYRVPIILDGVITGAAALLATRMKKGINDYMIASHHSLEPAHDYVLKELNLSPLVNWQMRLGEGSGALLVLPVLVNACKVMAETATFEDARVSTPHKIQGKYDVLPSQAPVTNDFQVWEREAVYKAILARRDIRAFLPDPIPDAVLERILVAAHHGPSVGYMQPWNFILIQDKIKLRQIQEAVDRERIRSSENYQDLKKDYYLRLKVEGLMQASLTICVTNDSNRGGPHVLGRNTIPETDLMSTSCAIENMWLAARVEGIGLGWVSIYEKDDIRKILEIPDYIDPVALLSLGYTAHFPDIPLLERVGWGSRLDLKTLIYQGTWGKREKNDL